MFTQANREIWIESPLPPDTLLLSAARVVEKLSEPFLIECEVLTQENSIAPESLLWKAVRLSIRLADGQPRSFHGYVDRIEYVGLSLPFHQYRLRAVPHLSLLALHSDSRIFQHQSTPEIVKTVFAKYQGLEALWKLIASYVPREYCVQYQETDLQFVSRLLEEEGIHYHFEPSGERHRIVLSDSPGTTLPCPRQDRFEFQPNLTTQTVNSTIHTIHRKETIRTVNVALTDYDFEKPRHSLLVNAGAQSTPQIFEYPGNFLTQERGDALARIRLEEIDAHAVVYHGTGDSGFLTAGHRMEVFGHPFPEFNQRFLLTCVEHRMVNDNYRTHSAAISTEPAYRNSWSAISFKVPYRPRRVTPKQRVMGAQTAVVVGTDLDRPYTEEYGRVKVHFHWDRWDQQNQESSCWIRVSQPWAGRGWGTVAIPRVGQEVIVDFLEGDPDRPIITGRVYNNDMMPPFPLPAGAVHMGFRSRSIGGRGYNEISVDDTLAQEGITIHAEKNMDTVVENDESLEVRHCRTKKIFVDEGTDIGQDRSEKVGRNESVSIAINRTHTVGQNELLTIGASRTHSVGSNEMISVKGTQQTTIGGPRFLSVAGGQTTEIGGAQKTSAGAEIHLSSPKITLTATNQLRLECGGGHITIDSSGVITIHGTLVKVNC